MKSACLGVLFLILQPAWTWAQVEAPGTSSQEVPNILRTIQYECLRAWTPDLVYDLTGKEELPSKVLDDASLQQEFFTETVRTQQGFFYPSILEELGDALEYYVTPGVRFLDLGSGDGRVAFMANILGADATGIESDPRLFETSQRARAALQGHLAEERLTLVQEDYFNVSWSDYDIVFYYDLGSDNPLLFRQKLFAELRPGAIFLVAYPEIPFPGLAPETTFDIVTAYRMPETLAKTDERFLGMIENEVLGLHDFLEDWFNGNVPKDEQELARFRDVLNPGFQLITEAGKVKGPKIAADEVGRAHGLWRTEDGKPGQIQLNNFALRFKDGTSAVVSYDEWHVSNGQRRGFKTTAVLQLRWGQVEGVEWLHLHRSAFPPFKKKEQ